MKTLFWKPADKLKGKKRREQQQTNNKTNTYVTWSREMSRMSAMLFLKYWQKRWSRFLWNWNFRQVTHFPWSCHMAYFAQLQHIYTYHQAYHIIKRRRFSRSTEAIESSKTQPCRLSQCRYLTVHATCAWYAVILWLVACYITKRARGTGERLPVASAGRAVVAARAVFGHADGPDCGGKTNNV